MSDQTDSFEVPLPDGVALITARLAIYAVINDDGTNGYIVYAKGDTPMTTYLGLTVVAQQNILEWGDR